MSNYSASLFNSVYLPFTKYLLWLALTQFQKQKQDKDLPSPNWSLRLLLFAQKTNKYKKNTVTHLLMYAQNHLVGNTSMFPERESGR